MNGSFRNSKLHIFSSSATPDTRFTPAKGTQERLSGKFSTSDEVDRLTFIHPEENPVKIRGLDKPSGPKTDLPCNRRLLEYHCPSTNSPRESDYVPVFIRKLENGSRYDFGLDRRGVTGESRIRKKTVRAAPLHKNSHPLFRRWLFRIAGRRYTSPEKPMKAMARIPAVISAIGTPLNALGTSSNSSLSRMPAKSTSARANPSAVATE